MIRIVICIHVEAHIKKRTIVLVYWTTSSQIVDLDIFFICPRRVIYDIDFINKNPFLMKSMKQFNIKLFFSLHYLQKSQLHVIMKTKPSYILQNIFDELFLDIIHSWSFVPTIKFVKGYTYAPSL